VGTIVMYVCQFRDTQANNFGTLKAPHYIIIVMVLGM